MFRRRVCSLTENPADGLPRLVIQDCKKQRDNLRACRCPNAVNLHLTPCWMKSLLLNILYRTIVIQLPKYCVSLSALQRWRLLFQLRFTWILERRSIPCKLADETKCREIERTCLSISTYELWLEFKKSTSAITQKGSRVTPKWFKHAAFWSGVRRATIAPRSQLWKRTLKYVLYCEESSQVVFGKLLTPVLCNCLETSKSALHSSAAACKAPKQVHNAVTPVAQWTSVLDF